MHHATDKNLPPFVGPEGLALYSSRKRVLALDFETTNLTNGAAIDQANHLVLACWSIVEDGYRVDKHIFGDEYAMQPLLDDIRDSSFIVAHNAKFELQWLSRCGLDLRDAFVYDTMVSEWVIQGNRRAVYALDDMARRYGVGVKESLVSKLIKNGINPADIPQSWLLEYCKVDVDVCYKVFLEQIKEIDAQDVWHLILQRNLVVPVLADIEMQGLELDKDRVYAEEERLQNVIEELGGHLDEITGGINLGSPKQLGEFLYDRIGFAAPLDNGGKVITTPGGSVSTAEPALAKLVATTGNQRKFLELYKEYNKATTLLTKNVAFFKKVCDEKDGKFFGQLRQCRTANHRLASTGSPIVFKPEKGKNGKDKKATTSNGVQIQNLPRQYKSLFTVHDDDYEVTEYDGSQIEFRVAAELGHDKQAEADIVNGVDIHSFTRDTMNAAWLSAGIRKEIDRQGAKPQTFAPLYGSQGKDVAEQGYANAFAKKYHGIRAAQDDWTLTVADRKKLTTPYGLTFHWPNATMHRSGYVSFTTEIYNLPISGFATGEIIPIALVFFWHRIKGTHAKIFNTVHDSIIVYNLKTEVDEVTDIAKQAMTHDVYDFLDSVYNYQFSVPLGFGKKTGSHWGDTDVEEKWDVWRDGNERKQVEENKQVRLEYGTRLN